MNNPTPTLEEQPDDYKNIIDLLAVHQEAKLRISILETEVQTGLTDLIDEHKAEYTELQSKVTESESAIIQIAKKHPEWFTDKRNIKTPYGTVKVTRSSKLTVDNPAETIRLIKVAGKATAAKFLRIEESLNLEALEKLADVQLADFLIDRERSENVTVKESRLDLGKAVKAETTSEEAAA